MESYNECPKRHVYTFAKVSGDVGGGFGAFEIFEVNLVCVYINIYVF